MTSHHTGRSPPRIRRGSQAVEFALTMPVLLLLAAGAIDVGQFLYLSERVAAVASEGARRGALADLDSGEDPITLATAGAQNAWAASELPGALTVVAAFDGAVPSRRVVVTTTVDAEPFFGFLDLLPTTLEAVRTVRLSDQD